MANAKLPIRMYDFVLNSLVGVTYENPRGEEVLITEYKHRTPVASSTLIGNPSSISLSDLLESCTFVNKESSGVPTPKRVSTQGTQADME